MGVSGEVHLQALQPVGQVPPMVGVTHVVMIATGPGTVQQSWPEVQHCVSQQSPAGPHMAPLHGGVPHLPLSQYGFGPVHVLPHVPQLWMSLSVLTQAEPQQVKSHVPQLMAVPVLLVVVVLEVEALVVAVAPVLLAPP
jgi:hypothetical protein